MEIWRKNEVVLITVLICILGCINGDTDPNDAAALRNMFNSFGSPGQLTKWTGNGGDPCGESWKGVTCTGTRVTEIKLSGLSLSGSIGYQFTSLPVLTNLDLSNNNFAGGIPYGLSRNLTRINFANNQLNGDIPYDFSSMTKLTYLNVAHNQLQNQLSDMFAKLSFLSTLDLSFNQLPGNLPWSFRNLSSITTLFLQNNRLTGTVDVLADLPLKNLNIANNQFTGWIPPQLKDIHPQTDGNNWNSGPAPPPPPGTPPAHRNPGRKPGGNNSPSESDGNGSKKSGISGGAIAGIIISLLVVGGIIAFFIIKKRSKKSSSDIEKLDQPFAPLASNEVQEMKAVQPPTAVSTKTFDSSVSFNLRPPPVDRHKSFDDDDFSAIPVVKKKTVTVPTDVTSYSIADLQIATGSFSVDRLLGEGSFGRVYQAQFDDGKVLAVKKIDTSTLSSDMSNDFLEMVSKISKLHHPNVTELMGYCSEHGQHLLVYEYHKNGSLHDFLHLSDEDSKPLIWNTRVKIALGTARALEYMHEVCSPSIIHKNIKSGNILLDAELNPHLSDSGLASFLPNAEQALNNNAGSGYGAPEVAMSGQYTLKSDVYGFGVVMLELLTGRKPFDSSRPRSEQSVVGWATPQLHDIDALSKMVDPALKGLYPVKSLSRFADVIALCVQPEPEFRPPMSEVVQALVRLVQRANMSKRTVGNEPGASRQAENTDAHDYM
ncbi:protein STRUBBELIG-RECEPTOR FAMILY 6-like [Mercurialis annua]|uniref:protein STRUBBELIG-RECEPTOR FAMILY 6-like n=1 Tax=Mercurialis annua TaxID=3986 RepID=UPI00215FA9CD|nr:protein STRUBBELIG-RECEPTOR FAMILY 6-like [Mercurialis annua]